MPEIKEWFYYFFALTFHALAITVLGGVIREISDENGNWVSVDGDNCYRGGYGVFRNTDGTGWFDVIKNTTTTTTPPCNVEATAELIIIVTTGAIVALDTLVTVVYWIYAGCKGELNTDKYALFRTWKPKSEELFDMARKSVRAASVLSAYLMAFTWACGFTASFNSRPGAFGVDRGVMMHPDNGAFEASGYLIAFMIAILVTILPRNEDAGYSSLY